MLAIKALLQDQKYAKRDEHPNQTKEIPWDTRRRNISNNTTRSSGSDADKSDPPATLRAGSQNQAPLDVDVSGSKLNLRGLESSAPIRAVQSPRSPRGTTKPKKCPPGEYIHERVQHRGQVVRPDPPEPKLRIGIHLFLLKPVVENFFDKVELTWLLQHIPMPESAIHRYLDQQTYEGYDVFDMLHKLHPYEKNILGGVIFGIDMSTEGSLLSLKRTQTTTYHRDITFRDVPGLQFVVRREDRTPDAIPPHFWERKYSSPPSIAPHPGAGRPDLDRAHTFPTPPSLASYHAPHRIHHERARGRETTHPRRGRAPSQSRQDDIIDYDDGWLCAGGRSHHSRTPPLRARRSRAARRGRHAIESDEDSYSPARITRRTNIPSGSEDHRYFDLEAEVDSMSSPEQNEDAVIDDMLKKYTTLFD